MCSSNQRNGVTDSPQLFVIILVVMLGGVLLSCTGPKVERSAPAEQAAVVEEEVTLIPTLTATSEASESLATATRLMSTATAAAQTPEAATTTPELPAIEPALPSAESTPTPDPSATPQPTEQIVEPFVPPEIIDPYQAFQEMGYNVEKAQRFDYVGAPGDPEHGISFSVYVGFDNLPLSPELQPAYTDYVGRLWL